ncbi:MAG TPA: hypothetical protein VND64_35715 [Pirellulales bacterium]|nr:hypothetical protein [Pirellulales bacterium]
MEAWNPTDAAIANGWTAVSIAIALAVAGGIGLLRTDRELRGTTLLAPWRWACFSFATLAVGEVIVAWPSVDLSPVGADHVRYLAGVTTLAPFVALLGAKRPQDRAWQWIVLALLLLLALPIGKAFVFDSGAPPAPHAAWRLLLAILLSSQLANHLPTSVWPAAFLAGLAQLGWLAGYLPGVANRPSGTWPLAGLALATAAIWLVRRPVPRGWIRKNSGRRRLPCRPIDRLWLEFRDSFGALWALRVAERFNASAELYGWPARLWWGGMREAEVEREKGKRGRGDEGNESPVESEADVAAAMRQNLRTLLWRFVSPEWIAQRLGDQDPSPGIRQM